MPVFSFTRSQGHKFEVEGTAGIVMTWGNGFRRERANMGVVQIKPSEWFAYHLDTAAGIDHGVIVDDLQDLAGFFGYCPKAISLYRSLAIDVRAAA